jgi:hypothetical protein
MKNHITIRKLIFAVLFAGVAVLSIAGTANAFYLYWGKTHVNTSVLNVCHSFANDAMRSLNFQNIRLSQDEVAGTSGGTYAAITCVGTNPVTAIVMVVGNDNSETVLTRDNLKQKIAGIKKFD